MLLFVQAAIPFGMKMFQGGGEMLHVMYEAVKGRVEGGEEKRGWWEL